jgi:hypothetical protein
VSTNADEGRDANVGERLQLIYVVIQKEEEKIA